MNVHKGHNNVNLRVTIAILEKLGMLFELLHDLFEQHFKKCRWKNLFWNDSSTTPEPLKYLGLFMGTRHTDTRTGTMDRTHFAITKHPFVMSAIHPTHPCSELRLPGLVRGLSYSEEKTGNMSCGTVWTCQGCGEFSNPLRTICPSTNMLRPCQAHFETTLAAFPPRHPTEQHPHSGPISWTTVKKN